jgi:maltose O-acetyltransferase
MLAYIRQKIISSIDSLQKRKRDNYIKVLKKNGLILGKNVRFAADVFLDRSHCALIRIGNNVTFAPNVRLIAHDASMKQYLNFTRIGLVQIHDDCFIGDSVIVLPGVTIGPRTIIGAGSIVTKDIPKNTVAVGNPARVICSLEEYLLKMKKSAQDSGVLGKEYWEENLTKEKISQMHVLLSSRDGFIL